MVARADVVAAARRYISVPFKHQGRSLVTGIDCVGLIIGVAHELAISDFDVADYSRSPDPRMMRAHLLEHLDEIGFKQVLPGDILWYRIERDPQHLGIVTTTEPEICMVHAFAKPPVQACVEQPLGQLWKRLIAGCFRYRGIA